MGTPTWLRCSAMPLTSPTTCLCRSSKKSPDALPALRVGSRRPGCTTVATARPFSALPGITSLRPTQRPSPCSVKITGVTAGRRQIPRSSCGGWTALASRPPTCSAACAATRAWHLGTSADSRLFRAMITAVCGRSPGLRSLLVVCGSGVGLPGGEHASNGVAGGGPLVLRAMGAARAGSGGFRCTGRRARLRVQVPEPPADPGRGEPVRFRWPFPRPAEICGERTGEAELCVGGQDEPGPAIGRGRVTEPEPGPAEGLLEQAEGVPDHHSQTGLLTPPLGSFASVSLITVPSMMATARRGSPTRPCGSDGGGAGPISVVVEVTAVSPP